MAIEVDPSSPSYSLDGPSSSSRRTPDDELVLPKKQRSFPVEIPVLLLFLSWNLTGTVFQYQILYQTCTVSLGFNETECSKLGQGDSSQALQDLEKTVQTYATKIFMCRAILENIVPAMFSLFIGPWSDKFGRKPVLLCSYAGYFFVYFSNAVISYISDQTNVSPWYYLLSYIPVSLSGGTCALITILFCYLTDVSTEDDRAFRMARMEAAVFVGLLLGSLTSNYIYQISSTQFMFAIASLSVLIALVYIKMLVTESVKIAPENSSGAVANFKALFEVGHVYDTFSICFKKRENYNRAIIWLTILSLASQIFVLEGSVTLTYLFVRDKFDWTIGDYNLYAATSTIMQVFGNIIGIYILSKLFGISEIVLAIIAYASATMEYVIVAFAMYPWQLYLATCLALLKGVATPMCRSMLASVVPSNEIGKLYAFTTSIESLAPIGSAPTYTFVYNYTINNFPGAYNLLSSSILLGCTLYISIVYVFNRRRQNVTYGPIH